MSVKQEKEKQNYVSKPVWPICFNCRSYRSKKTTKTYRGSLPWKEESHLRCFLGKFKILKGGTCDEHVYKVEGK